MYPRNAASPPRILIGPVIQISDGAVQSSGVSIFVRPNGGSETAGGGTISYGGSTNAVYYTPTQAETDYTDFVVVAYKTGCWPVGVTVITTAESTAGTVKTGSIAANAINAAALATDAVNEIVDAVWDEILTGATHNVASSAGRRLRQLASVIVHSGTAQGAGTGNNQIQLDTGASSTNGAYDPSLVFIESGTGAGQCRLILQYNGTTKVATVDRDWRVNPDNTSEFVIVGDAGRESVNEGLAQAGTSTTITLNTNAASTDDAYNGQLVFIRSGTGQDQVALIEDYVGSTKVATIRTRTSNGQWATTPDTTSAYVIVPNLTWTISEIQSGLATSASLSTVESKIDAIDDYVDTEVAAIKAKTDNLPSDPADQSAVEAAITAATSGLATSSSLSAVETKIDTIDDYLDTEVAAIKAKTDNLPTDPADQSAVEAAITAAQTAITTAMAALATATELAKVPKAGETRRYTQIAANSGSKTADVSIGNPLP